MVAKVKTKDEPAPVTGETIRAACAKAVEAGFATAVVTVRPDGLAVIRLATSQGQTETQAFITRLVKLERVLEVIEACLVAVQ